MQGSRNSSIRYLMTGAIACLLLWAVHTQASLVVIGANTMLYSTLHVVILIGCLFLTRLMPTTRTAPVIILLLALTARVLMFPLETSDDAHRYIWEGRVQAAGFNPYHLPPDAAELEFMRSPDWSDINHRDKTAIYPPGFMLAMRVLTSFADTPSKLKGLVVIADMLTLIVLLALLGQYQRKSTWAILYALNPVVLSAFAGEGHLDAFMILFMVGSLYLFQRKRWLGMFLALAMAMHVKYVAVILLPFMLRRANLRWLWVFVIATALPFAVFSPISEVFTTLSTFSREMDFNGSVHDLLGRLLGSRDLAALVTGLVFIAACLLTRLGTANPLGGGAWCMAALLMLYPTVHFWYLTWLIPFLCFFPVRSGLLFYATITFSFASQGHQTHHGEWKEFHLFTILEYLPVYMALLFDMKRMAQPKRLADREAIVPVESVSVVIPTLNEEEQLPRLLGNIVTLSKAPIEVLVGDGGSTDRTTEIAKQHGALVVPSEPGRGQQIAAAVDRARGDVVFIAHADMHLDGSCLDRIVEALNKTGAPGGCLGCTFDRPGYFLRVIDELNNLRAGLFGLSFGDQGQFVRRDSLEAMGGFPPQPIMEDVELSYRFKEVGRPVFLGGGITASTRRWRSLSKWKHAFLVVTLVAKYMWRRAFSRRGDTVSGMYEAYYPSK